MKIAIIGSIHKDGLEFLRKNQCKILEINNYHNEQILKQLVNVEGIIVRTANLTSEILSKCKKLKIVSRHGVGYDNIDTNYLKKNQIALGITSTSNAISVSEHVMAMFLYLTKKINLSNQITKTGNFDQRNIMADFFELYNKNVVIFGFGRIGKEVAKRCHGFDAKIFVNDPYIDKKEIIKKNCLPIEKNEALEIADYISIHLPLNEKTKNYISFKEFKKFKENLILVNTARGGIINEEALYLALKENKICGAGLDVFVNEPPEKNHPLFSLENTILTPHNAALTLECRKRMSVEACENVYYYITNNSKLIKNNIIKIF